MTDAYYVGNSEFLARVKAASDGDVDAMIDVARSLSRSARQEATDRHVPASARAWFDTAIIAGSIRASIELALEQHAFGDVADALDTLRRAAPGGDPEVAYNLGGMLAHEQIEDDPDGPYVWLERAADAGHDKAMCHLGILHSLAGRPDEAREWWTRSADAGNGDAMYNLMQQALRREDYDSAAEWFRRAIDVDHPEALFLGGQMQEPQDESGARSYYELAARQGHSGAQAALRRLDSPGSTTP